MKAERWQQIEELYHKARELEPKRRVEFLKQACGDDDELRQEVGSLLASEPETGKLLQRPTVEMVAMGMLQDPTRSLVGRQVGSYEILSLLGVGGMGEVYRARDAKLNREIAIKVLPAAFAQDPDRLARFEREARLLASLNHPNIAAIYGLEELDEVRYLVLELVPGDTLAQRLESHPLAVREALEMCRQIAEALEAAHEKGIIHRDLKPVNVKVTSEGRVKVLDFGLAKVVEADLRSSEASEVSTIIGATTPGTILGTVAYMSPEQACGKPLDRRTDVWSFGCVMYEVLAGKRAFSGETNPEVLGRILEKEPKWEALPAGVPENVRCMLRRALQKDPRCRLRDMGDARIELEDTIAGRMTAAVSPAQRARARKRLLAGAMAMVLVGAAGTGGLAWHLGRRSVPAPPVTRFTISLPENQQIVTGWTPGIMFSRDGRILTFNSPKLGYLFAYQRALDDLEVKPLLGIKHVGLPCFSPDDKWVAVVDNATFQLKKVALGGGAPVPLTDLDMWVRGDWGSDGYIYFTERYPGSINRIPENGGRKELVTTLDPEKQEFTHKHAQILPGGKAIIFTVVSAGVESYDDAHIEVQRLNTKQRKMLIEGGFCPRYSPSGHILYAREGSLYAVPFDVGRLELTGPAMKVVDDVLMSTNTGAAYYDISSTGSLAYAEGKSERGERTLVWVDRQGRAKPLPLPPRSYLFPRISPDQKTLAVEIEGPTHNLYTYDLERAVMTKITTDGLSHAPVWTPDGKNLCFRSWKAGTMTMWRMPSDRSSPEVRLTTVGAWQSAVAVSLDGRYLTFNQTNKDTGIDVYVLPLDGRSEPRPLVQSKFGEAAAKFSPDGKWVAYCSNESGKPEAFVQPWPGPGPKIQISSEGGTDPLWNQKGDEIFYRNGDKMMVVPVSMAGGFKAGKPRLLWEGHYSHGMSSSCGPPGVSSGNYCISADGQHFLMVKDNDQDVVSNKLVVILNWTRTLEGLTGGK